MGEVVPPGWNAMSSRWRARHGHWSPMSPTTSRLLRLIRRTAAPVGAARTRRRRDARGRGHPQGGRRCDDAPAWSLSACAPRAGSSRRCIAHHHAPPGALFCVGVADDDRLACVAIVSRPVARMLDASPVVAEVTRCASDHAARRRPWRSRQRPVRLSRSAIAASCRTRCSAKRARPIAPQGGSSRVGRGVVGVALAPRAHDDGAAPRSGGDGTDALPADGAAALVAALCIGRVEIPVRRESLPLLQLGAINEGSAMADPLRAAPSRAWRPAARSRHRRHRTTIPDDDAGSGRSA